MRQAAEQAADAIREDILAGRIPAGARIAEAERLPTGDGDLVLIAANQDSVFGRLAAVMDQPGLAADPASPPTQRAARP
ncbi:MAG TPA: hypothetical protein VK586_00755 [Streptosporangiaceae bacterium]|nr:hypothetical protein [Streptosporangiaceae bacterium]